jgi:hypothetical protein
MSDWNPTPPPYPPPTGQQAAVPPPGSAPGGGSNSNGRTAVIAVLTTLAVVAVIGGAFLLGRAVTKDDEPVATKDTTTTSTTTAPPTTAAPVTGSTLPPPTTALGDVRALADGLFCRDLKAQGYSYSAAVDYWRVHGQPNRMDEDRNGIPCETVYPRADVVAYWPASTYEVIPSYGLPSGLLCRDLADRGIDVYGALTYFIWEGYPERMDADGNGIPCETVYPDATEVWLFEF